MKKHLLTSIVIIVLIVSCKQKGTQNIEISEQKSTTELKAGTENKIDKKQNLIKDTLKPEFEIRKFDQNLVEQLYNNLKSNFEIDFKQKHLNNVLDGVKISELNDGKEFEKEMLFENFNCECYDKIRISYSDKRYILWIYEAFYEKDLDWCPESSYSYSFTIVKDKITDLKLDFMAG
jgi:hypothetical protein